jgi:2-methylcitrate dehydratase PrpD
MLMSAWSMILDFDDVMMGGHLGHSSVLVPLAMCGTGRYSGEQALLAQVVANEIAGRINMACAVGSTRGQMATHVHLVSAAAARAKLEGLGPDDFARCLAFAISYPSQALYPAFLGSDAKAFCASFPIRIGMEAVDAVLAGMKVTADPLEDPKGFFANAARIPMLEFLDGLGQRWHSATNSYKLHPVSGYLSAAVEATTELARTHEIHPDEIDCIEVWSSLFTIGMDRHSAPYLCGPDSCISTLTFSLPFAVASTVLARGFGPEQLRNDWICRQDVWELARRVRSHHSVNATLAALTASIPVGAALRRLKRWQAAMFGWKAAGLALGRNGLWRKPDAYRVAAGLFYAAGDRSSISLCDATKPIGARVALRFKNGHSVEHFVDIPLGFKRSSPDGSDWTDVRPLLLRKFTDSTMHFLSQDCAQDVLSMLESFHTLSGASIRGLLRRASIFAPQAVS